MPFVALLNRVIFSVRFWACLYLAALIYLAVPIIAQAASGPVAVVKSGPLDLECFWAKNRTALVCSSLTTVGAYVILSQGHIAVYRGAKLVYYGSR